MSTARHAIFAPFFVPPHWSPCQHAPPLGHCGAVWDACMAGNRSKSDVDDIQTRSGQDRSESRTTVAAQRQHPRWDGISGGGGATTATLSRRRRAISASKNTTTMINRHLVHLGGSLMLRVASGRAASDEGGLGAQKQRQKKSKKKKQKMLF